MMKAKVETYWKFFCDLASIWITNYTRDLIVANETTLTRKLYIILCVHVRCSDSY